jgi:hypothetical protein
VNWDLLAPARTIDTVAGRFDIRASSITVVGPTSPDGAGRDRLSVLEPWGTHSGSSAIFPQTSSYAPNTHSLAHRIRNCSFFAPFYQHFYFLTPWCGHKHNQPPAPVFRFGCVVRPGRPLAKASLTRPNEEKLAVLHPCHAPTWVVAIKSTEVNELPALGHTLMSKS